MRTSALPYWLGPRTIATPINSHVGSKRSEHEESARHAGKAICPSCFEQSWQDSRDSRRRRSAPEIGGVRIGAGQHRDVVVPALPVEQELQGDARVERDTVATGEVAAGGQDQAVLARHQRFTVELLDPAVGVGDPVPARGRVPVSYTHLT